MAVHRSCPQWTMYRHPRTIHNRRDMIMVAINTFDLTDKAREAGLLPADGWTVRLYLTPDTASTPIDADCYSAWDIARWERDEWHYVTLRVALRTPDGTEWGAAYLGGVEHGFEREDGTVFSAQDHPDVPDLIREARDEARKSAQRAVDYITQALGG